MLTTFQTFNFIYFLPEYFLAFSILALTLFLSITTRTLQDREAKRTIDPVLATCMFIIFCSFLIFISLRPTNILVYDSQFVFDHISFFFQFFMLVLVFIFFAISKENLFILFYKKTEYVLLFLGSLLGALLLVCSNDLLLIYLNIELMSLAFYCLAAARKKSSASTESGVKYFILGAFSSVFLLLGIGLLYGIYGTINLSELRLLLLSQSSSDPLFLLIEKAYIFIAISFFFKTSAVPFHFWSPDTYEGAPSSATFFFSLVPKLAFFPAFIRILVGPVLTLFVKVSYLFILVGLLSILMGSFLAVKQKTIKRIFAYSSISHAGYIFLALGTNSLEGIQVAFFYLIVYALTTVGVWLTIFAIYTSLRKHERPLTITDYILVSKAHPALRWSALVFFFSLIGLPPFVGFSAKAFVIWSALGSYIIYPCILALTISVVSSFYYLRLIKISFEELRELERINQWYYQFKTDLSIYPLGTTFFIHWLLCFFAMLMLLLFLDPSYFLLHSELMALCLF